MSGHDAALPVFHASDGGRRPRSRGFFGALCPQLQTLHGEIARASTVNAGPKTDVVSSLLHAEQDGHSGRTRAEDLSFVLALPLSTAVSRLYFLRSCSCNNQLAYTIDILRLLRGLDTANGKGGGPGCYE